jgi:signal transduction histidine kinase
VRPVAVRVSLAVGDGPLSATWPSNMDSVADVVVPVRHEGVQVGEIALAGRNLGPADVGIVNQLAVVAAPALRSIGLLAELRSVQAAITRQNQELAASRSRLVAAAEAERVRLADLITSRLDPLLIQIRQLLPDVARDLAERPEAAEQVLAPLAGLASQVVSDLREVSRGVLPRLMVDHGLGAALRALVRRLDRPVALDVPPDLAAARLPAEIETTVYLCCRAALGPDGANSVTPTVRVWREAERLSFRIEPIRVEAEALSLRDRVEALDGELLMDGLALMGSMPLADGAAQERPASLTT